VVGAGAAGLLAALFAAKAGARVRLLETRPKPGAKIRVSGGGRCNVLPSSVSSDDFATSGTRRTIRNLFGRWPLPDVRRFFEDELGVPLKTEPTGKVFPVSDRSKDVVDALLGACGRAGVELVAGARVADIRTPVPGRASFELATVCGETFAAASVVLATGGLSLPLTGSDGFGLRWLERAGHRIAPTHPALVPLVTPSPWAELAGVALPVRATVVRDGRVADDRRGDFLFTHRGFSGPVVLDVSGHFTSPTTNRAELRVGWGDVDDWDATLRAGGAGTVGGVVRNALPRRLADRLLALAGVDPSTSRSELARTERAWLVEILARTVLPVSGSEGYRTAEVTAGGVILDDVVGKTLESRIVPRLFLCGELLDATGRLGGYNFYWAWVSGRVAGEAAASVVS
jgi:hypothetical protein